MASSSLPDEETLAELKEFASQENLKYQQIPGLTQAGAADRSYLNSVIFPEGSDDTSLLDIGSNLGYFCLEASKRGFGQAVGIDPDIENIRKADRIAKIMKSNAEYIQGNFENYDWGNKKFDVILCLNVLHHLFDPVHAIRRMIDLAQKRIVIEFAEPRLRDVLRGKLPPSAYLSLIGPAIVLGSPENYSDGRRTFVFTRKAMRIIFNKHYSVFEPLKLTGSPFKGRVIAEATRRQIDHLVVVAGPTAAGKTTLVGRLQTDPNLRSMLSLETSNIPVCNAGRKVLPAGKLKEAFFHYDILRPFGRSLRSIDRDISMQLLTVPKRLTVLTLMTEIGTMQDRMVRDGFKGKYAARHRAIHESYNNPEFLRQWYREWFTTVGSLAPTAEHRIVTTGAEGAYGLTGMSDAEGALELIR